MWRYDAPLRTMRFVLDDVLEAPVHGRQMPRHDSLDMETGSEVLRQAARFASEVLQPLNAVGDREGCRLVQGQVKTPTGFVRAWQAFVDGGWPALACDADDGGQGLPALLNAALFEMLVSANHAWTMYPGLLHGAYETLKAHADVTLRERYLPMLASGQWLAAMALTEPQAGSDLARVSTKAVPRPDGSVSVHGSKIFISGADHDMTENIVHLVLCRLPDAPGGSKGLSLALVPKVLPDGTRNAIACDSLEHKMGLHGSATCAVRYEGAVGWLVGQPNRGLSAMFVMMNSARLHVALQGLGHLEMASQNACRYALERRQMRAPSPRTPLTDAADPIAEHPAVRRTLLDLQAVVEGLRVLLYRTALRLDLAHDHPDAAQRECASVETSLLTPIAKAFATRLGFEGVSNALQVFGGYGYIAEYGIEQSLRDVRIAMIYEGTNEIQAIDLLQRKVLGDEGRQFHRWLEEFKQFTARPVPEAPLVESLWDQAVAAVAALLRVRQEDPEAPLRVADDFLMGMGYALLGSAWISQLAAAEAAMQRGDEDAQWLAERMTIARHGLRWVLPQGRVHWTRVLDMAPLGAVTC